MKKVVLLYGLLAGFIIGGITVASMLFSGDTPDFTKAEIIGYAAIVIGLITIFVAVKSFRDNYNGGVVSFGKAFLIGLYITLIASALRTGAWMVYYYTGDGKAHMEQYFEAGMEQINNSDLPEQEKEAKRAEMKMGAELMQNPFIMAGFSFLVEMPWIGVILSLIAAAIFQRKEPK